MRSLLSLLTCALVGAAGAAPLPAASRAEVDALLMRLQFSGCDFNRNGSWYTGAEAKGHLLKKLDYLEGKDLVHTTEQFISLGASTSSMSGKPYLARCPGKPTVPLGAWLNTELQALRPARAASAPNPAAARSGAASAAP